ncbi:SRSF protein kinase 1-like isoform X2 [Zingiber officinale]|uniref:SRSF protein kinase 1-like isoform X2 n=1 Tax=Zingiber officinale TaxID=94328 RepID=UPI001C4C88B6|nr:SRSF protein kinase 1-like isoform X2 [Zingiber officinale]
MAEEDGRSESSNYTSEDEGSEDYRRGGYHAVRIGDSFKQGAYVVQAKLGWGHFSTVWLAWDTVHSRYVALKVQKSAQHYTEAAMDEIKILKQIADGDPDGTRCVVKLLDHFKHLGPNGHHVCMVFEFLGDNLLTLIKYTDYRGMPLSKVKEICRYVLIGLDYLHRDLSIIHTDLKPENILLLSSLDPAKDPYRSGTPLILSTVISEYPSPISPARSKGDDLMRSQKKKVRRKVKCAAAATAGSSTAIARDTAASEDKGDSKAVNDVGGGEAQDGTSQGHRRGSKATRKRLAMEADLRCKLVDFGNACWTYKQFTNDIQTRQYRCPEDHLALMMELLGMIPRKIALGGRYSRDFFNRYGDLRHIRQLRCWPLNKVLMEKYEFSERDANDMADFLVPILDFAPEKRPTAAQLLLHPWLDTGPQIHEPSLPQSNKIQPSAEGPAEKQGKEKDEREAMAIGLGNITIDGSTKLVKDPQPHSKLSKVNIPASTQ